MKTLRRFLGLLFCCAALVPVPLSAGGQWLLYPLARAFGGPSEAELAKCRTAFARLKADFPSSRVLVQPALIRPGAGLPDDRNSWRPHLADNLVQALRAEGGVGAYRSVEVRSAVAAVGATPFGHNQLRYLWTRAAEYGRCVRESHPAGDYVLFFEIFGSRSEVGAIQVFVFDASGQLAYCRLFNSHQFGPHLDRSGDAAVRLIAERLLGDLRKAPEEVFPPYGVG